MTRLRPRISLLALFFMMTVVAMAVAFWQLNAKLTPMQTELDGYRQQLGALSIPESDVDKIVAMQIDSEQQHEWKYRIYLPPGRQYQLHVRVGMLPGRTAQLLQAKDYYAAVAGQTSGSYGPWEAGEHVLAFRVQPDETNLDRKDWKFEACRVGEGRENSFTATVPWMADPRAWSISGSMAGRKQKVFDPDEPLPLLTVRQAEVIEKAGGYTVKRPDAKEQAEGFLLWIEAK